MSDSATKRSVLYVATASSFLTPFMGSATNVALPAIQKEFHLDAILLTWVATAYLLSCAVFLIPFGKIADIHGRKKVFVAGIAVFTLSSCLTAASVNSWMLLASRVLQGLGSAMNFATGMAILTSVFPPQERGRAIGITVAAVYIGLSAGPFIGGLLTDYFTWRSVFAVTIPLGLVTVYFAFWKLSGEWADARGEKLDLWGSFLYGMGMMLTMYGVSVLPSHLSFWTIGAGLLFIVSFVRWELKVPTPVFNMHLFTHNRTFAFSCAAALINYSATFATTFIISLYLQYIKGLSPRAAGLVLVSQPIVMALFSPLAGTLSDRLEPQKVASAGMAITAAGLFILTFLGWNTSITFVVANLALLGFGFALFSSPNMNAIVSSVDKRFYGIAAGSVGSMRLMGQMLSMGIATMVFSIYIGRVQISPANYPFFLESVHTIFVIFTVLCVLGIFASLARGKVHTENNTVQ